MIDLTAEQAALEGLATALRYEEDGKALRKDLARELRAAVEPAIPVIKAGVMAMTRTAGGAAVSPSLTTTVASKVRIGTRLTGDRAGVRVSIGRSGMPRGFANAPKRINSAKGWRHPVPRRGKGGSVSEPVWVTQKGVPGYFDRPLEDRRDEMRAAVVKAVQEMSERVARRAGRG